ncbi:hypothetical protein QQP08_008995 [Theobroma cacao]|nr:hypothetical protein QQP08_008995 [Theobroma cacao]
MFVSFLAIGVHGILVQEERLIEGAHTTECGLVIGRLLWINCFVPLFHSAKSDFQFLMTVIPGMRHIGARGEAKLRRPIPQIELVIDRLLWINCFIPRSHSAKADFHFLMTVIPGIHLTQRKKKAHLFSRQGRFPFFNDCDSSYAGIHKMTSNKMFSARLWLKAYWCKRRGYIEEAHTRVWTGDCAEAGFHFFMTVIPGMMVACPHANIVHTA